jgi:universal stress protein E
VPGVAFDRIRRYAEEHDVNIIMIGAGRKPGDEAFPLGITAARICREAGKPVWVVKPGAPERIERILCAVDFSDPSRRALVNAVHLARSFHAELTVLTAVPPLANWLGEAPADAQEAFVARQRARFDEFLQPLDFHGISHQAVVRLGQPHEQILAAVAELKADLLVMGSVGRTGVARVLMGSVAEKVAREMPCSIITVKAEHAIRLQVDEEIADIRAHFHQGRELLDGGFPAEAAGQFRQCIANSPVYAPAWEGLAEALARLGRDAEAEDARRHARQIVHTLWDRQIEAEIRSQHALWRKK